MPYANNDINEYDTCSESITDLELQKLLNTPPSIDEDDELININNSESNNKLMRTENNYSNVYNDKNSFEMIIQYVKSQYNVKREFLGMGGVAGLIVLWFFVNKLVLLIKILADLLIFTIFPCVKCALYVLSYDEKSENKKRKRKSNKVFISKSMSLLGELMIVSFMGIVLRSMYILEFIPIISFLTIPLSILSIVIAIIVQLPCFVINQVLLNVSDRYSFLNNNIMIDSPISDHIVVWLKDMLGNRLLSAVNIIEKIIGRYGSKKGKVKLSSEDQQALMESLKTLGIDLEYLESIGFNTENMDLLVKYLGKTINVIMYRTIKTIFTGNLNIKDVIEQIVLKIENESSKKRNKFLQDNKHLKNDKPKKSKWKLKKVKKSKSSSDKRKKE